MRASNRNRNKRTKRNNNNGFRLAQAANGQNVDCQGSQQRTGGVYAWFSWLCGRNALAK